MKQNGGAAGIDGMTITEMLPYLAEHREELLDSLRGGWYKPKPVRRVEIPKPDGGVRQLGVPTVIDRMVQQALHQVLQPIFEETFSDSSYGFRPGRNAHQAIKRAKEYYEQGYTHVVDIDLAKYFDTVNHDFLTDRVREQVKDERVIKLIRKFLKSGVMLDGLFSPTNEGTPQGGNLSPLLSNIYLTSFDRMLESRGHKFVRYADNRLHSDAGTGPRFTAAAFPFSSSSRSRYFLFGTNSPFIMRPMYSRFCSERRFSLFQIDLYS